MNCIKKQQLQQYIDGECQKSEMALIEKHLISCPICATKYTEMKQLASAMKQTINLLNVENVEIPPFKLRTHKSSKKPIKHLIYSLSAACIILFVLLFVDKKIQSNQKEIIIVQSVPTDIDANKPITDQELVIEVFDGRGNRSQYFIE
jgi:predicted anti-sigma-YlaC factor YlaD